VKRAIGGEFELDSLPSIKNAAQLTQNISGSWTVSGRAALFALLRPLKEKGIAKILIPAYLCESLLQPIKALDLKYEYYPVDENLAAYPEPSMGSAVILIHYFGWLNPSTKALREASRDSFVLIEDMTQSVLSSWKTGEDLSSLLFFSLRKFGPVPMGAWLNQVEKLPVADEMIKTIFWKSVSARMHKYIYLKTATEVDNQSEQTYLNIFRSIDNFFDTSCMAYDLDDVAKNLIDGVNWEDVASIRKNNWKYLHTRLRESLTSFHETIDDDVVPLGYVIRCTGRENFRKRLQHARIFCPVHWDLPKDLDTRRFPISYELSNSLMTIPIDQRYGTEDMEYITQVIREIGSC
jgi:hypothetical protein